MAQMVRCPRTFVLIDQQQETEPGSGFPGGVRWVNAAETIQADEFFCVHAALLAVPLYGCGL